MTSEIETANSLELRDIPITQFAGVGEKIAQKLAKLNLFNAQDILFHLPFRYEDRTQYTNLSNAIPNTSVLTCGEIIDVVQLPHGRRSLVIEINDGSGRLTIRLFHYSYNQKQAFIVGRWLECFGEVVLRATGKEMIHPEYRVLSERPTKPQHDRLTPVYPSTEGVSQHLLRNLSSQALEKYLPQVRELLPQELVERYGFCSLIDALNTLHRPQQGVNLEAMLEMESPAFQRLIFEELLSFHLGMQQVRIERQKEQSISLNSQSAPTLIKQFIENLPFQLTNAQQTSAAEIVTDLKLNQPMMRLVQGDVGSGKTVVAAIAVLHAVAAGKQVAVMAPTELLAEQLFRHLSTWLTVMDIDVGWLAGKVTAAQRRPILAGLEKGDIHVLVGTHALFQKGVEFHSLGLIIIDEQHRFGVSQRLALRDKANGEENDNGEKTKIIPHQLVMSATPIPRTLAMSFYADIDVSTIDELPPGRIPIETVVINADVKRDVVLERVHKACLEKTQVYWVCSLIDESEHFNAQAVVDVEQELTQRFKDVRIGVVHGRLKPAEKEEMMRQFRDHEIDLLLATTVIEVGVDVPNASLMIIENAERMGLSQLHQLRGRVGRGSNRSVCVLMYRAPLSENAKIRLQTMRETNDGFEIARKDLELRGPGELLGVRQTGAVSMRVANLVRDQHWLGTVEEEAQWFIEHHPNLVKKLLGRWLAYQQKYANA